MDTSKYTILLVDDDPALLRLLSIRLTAADYDVMTADNGTQALAQLAVHYPHLVITDLQMDGMDGMALFDTIHRSHPTLPVIILTASPDLSVLCQPRPAADSPTIFSSTGAVFVSEAINA